jgi:DNA-binding XRE family transcriptional regulator
MRDSILNSRRQFGALIATLRHQKKLTLVGLGKLLGLSHPTIVAVEQGRRAVGNELAGKLADALGVRQQDRQEFLFKAAATRINDRLIGTARVVSPAVVHFTVNMLGLAGIGAEQIVGARINDTIPASCSSRVQRQFELGLAEYFKAQRSKQATPLPFLELELDGGERAYCVLLVARSS